MRRIVNFRTMLVVALSETTLILCCYVYYVWHNIGIVLLVAYYVALGAILTLSYVFRKGKWSVALCACCIIGVATHVSFAVQYNGYHDLVPDTTQTYRVNGCVGAVVAQNGAISKVTVGNVRIDGKKIAGNVQISFADDDVSENEVPLGCTITASGSLYFVDLIDGKHVNGSAYRKDIRYTLYTTYAQTQTTPAKGSLFTRMRVALHDRLISACGAKYGSIAYCMLTGDKSELDESISRMFSLSGIGHVLAVSGLHVGILTAILFFVLRRLHVPRRAQIIVVPAFLLLYAAFVGFAASVVRSCIMCVIGMFTLVNGERKDALSSLSLAYAVILTVQPFLLFEVGFLLSFSAVLGLVLFARTFVGALRKIRFPKWLATPLGATFAVHIGIFPVTAYFFGAVQTYSLLCNLLAVPILSLVFVYFVLTAPVSVLLHFDFLLRIGSLGYAVVDLGIGVVSHLPFAEVYVHSHAALFCLYPLFFAASRFFMLPHGKRVVSCSIMALCAVIVAVPTLATLRPSGSVRHSVIAVRSYGDVTSIVVDDDGVTIIGDCKNTSALYAAMRANRLRKIDTVIVHRLTENVGKALAEFVRDVSVGKIVCPSGYVENEGLAALGGYSRFYVWEESELSAIRQVTTEKDKHVGFLYSFSEDVTVLFVSYSSHYTDLPAETIDAAPVIRCFLYLNAYADRVYLTDMPIGYLGEVPSYQYSVADYGTFVFDAVKGRVLQEDRAR